MIIIFNGPPASGKDEAASYYKKLGYKHISFKYALFKETISFFNVDEEWFMNGYNDRSTKEQPEQLLEGMSRREAMIYVSEEITKPVLGQDIFGVSVANEIQDGVDYVISDGGFIEELIPVINKVGTENILLVQLTRDGCDYSSDSRRYFNGSLVDQYIIGKETKIVKEHILPKEFPIRTYRVHNNGTINDFQSVIHDIYVKELNGQATAPKEGAGQF